MCIVGGAVACARAARGVEGSVSQNESDCSTPQGACGARSNTRRSIRTRARPSPRRGPASGATSRATTPAGRTRASPTAPPNRDTCPAPAAGRGGTVRGSTYRWPFRCPKKRSHFSSRIRWTRSPTVAPARHTANARRGRWPATLSPRQRVDAYSSWMREKWLTNAFVLQRFRYINRTLISTLSAPAPRYAAAPTGRPPRSRHLTHRRARRAGPNAYDAPSSAFPASACRARTSAARFRRWSESATLSCTRPGRRFSNRPRHPGGNEKSQP